MALRNLNSKKFFQNKANVFLLSASLAFAGASSALAAEGDQQDKPLSKNSPTELVEEYGQGGTPEFIQNQPTVMPEVKSDKTFSLSVAPDMSPALIGALGGSAMFLCLYYAARRQKGGFAGALTVSLMVAALLNTALSKREEALLPSDVAIIVDGSASQLLGDRPEQTAKALEALKAKLMSSGDVKLHVIEIGDGNDATIRSLEDAAEQVQVRIPETRLGGVFIITDGQIHSQPVFQEGVPVHVLLTGSNGESDRYVDITDMPVFAPVGESVDVEYQVIDENIDASKSSNVNVTIHVNGRLYKHETITPNAPHVTSIEIEHSGDNQIMISTEAIEGELTAANNNFVSSISGINEGQQILLLSSGPTENMNVLRLNLANEPSFELVSFSFLRSADKEDNVPLREHSVTVFPVHEIFADKLQEFDMIIMDESYMQGVLANYHFENIAEYVKNGGALLTLQGAMYESEFSLFTTPLWSILPVEPTGQYEAGKLYRPGLSDAGKKHPVVKDLPLTKDQAGRWVESLGLRKFRGHTLMESESNNPLLVLDRVHDGRVAFIGSTSLHLWDKGFDGGGPSHELLQNVMGWLMKKPEMEEEALSLLDVGDGLLEVTRKSLLDSIPDVTITAPSGAEQKIALEEVSPGVWQGFAEKSEVGAYVAEQGNYKVSYIAEGENADEMRNVLTDREKAIQISNGQLIDISDDFPKILDEYYVRFNDSDFIASYKQGASELALKAHDQRDTLSENKTPLVHGLPGAAMIFLAACLMFARQGNISFPRLGRASVSGSNEDSSLPDNVPSQKEGFKP